MKHLNTYITEYIIKKKLNKPIDSEDHYDYYPETKDELIKVIQMLLGKGETDLNCIDTSKITDMSGLFTYNIFNELVFDVSEWDVSNVKDMKSMFSRCIKFNCDLSNWDVHNVKDMSYMFYNCEKFEGKGFENWDVHNVEDMSGMFNGCINFEGKGLENWNVSKVENMVFMFCDCIKFDCDLSNWDVSNVEDMKNIFEGCKKFEGEGLENWNLCKVKDMNYIFDGCTSLKNKPSWYKE